MKKVIIAYVALLLIVGLLVFAKFGAFSFLPFVGNNKTATINNQKIKLLVANDEKSRQIGLSNRKSLPEDTGMLFIFPKKGKYGFWMKDTQIPLDIIYINDTKVAHIVKNAPPQAGKNNNLPIYTPPVDINYVLELNAGQADKYKIQNGSTVTFENVK